jgi:CHAT domain
LGPCFCPIDGDRSRFHPLFLSRPRPVDDRARGLRRPGPPDGTPDAGGLSGLAKAFFYAGARSLVVSNWEVPSKATVDLITGTFNELKKDPAIGRAEALRRAEMAMLDPNNPPEFAHPMMWAPFVIAGEGGAGR